MKEKGSQRVLLTLESVFVMIRCENDAVCKRLVLGGGGRKGISKVKAVTVGIS